MGSGNKSLQARGDACTKVGSHWCLVRICTTMSGVAMCAKTLSLGSGHCAVARLATCFPSDVFHGWIDGPIQIQRIEHGTYFVLHTKPGDDFNQPCSNATYSDRQGINKMHSDHVWALTQPLTTSNQPCTSSDVLNDVLILGSREACATLSPRRLCCGDGGICDPARFTERCELEAWKP
eukprot:s999_g12.t1